MRNCRSCNGKPTGNPIAVFPGYGVNPARANGADIEPVPIAPVRNANFIGARSVQLSNGWQNTNMGRRLAYDDYLRLLYSSANQKVTRRYILPGQGQQVLQGPSANQVLTQMNITGGTQPQFGTGNGSVAPGVNLAERRYYG